MFRLALVDAMMPEMDGFTLAKSIKLEADLAGIPIVEDNRRPIMHDKFAVAAGTRMAVSTSCGPSAVSNRPLKKSCALTVRLPFGPVRRGGNWPPRSGQRG